MGIDNMDNGSLWYDLYGRSTDGLRIGEIGRTKRFGFVLSE